MGRFRNAVRAAGRDPDALAVIVRANVPVTGVPITDGRPYLGGSPEQIAEDPDALDDLKVDQVLFSITSPGGPESHVELLGRLMRAAGG